MIKHLTIAVIALAVTAAALVAILHSVGLFRSRPRPHVVLIIIDTLRADRLGCYGCSRTISPEIDALSRRGVRFARAVAQCSWTRPSIGSLLTSIYPRTLGIHSEEVGILGDDVITLAEVLRDHGYRTLGATANPHLNLSFNFHQGFNHYLDTVDVFQWMPESFGQRTSTDPSLPAALDLFSKMLKAIDKEDANERTAPHYLQFNIMEVHENHRSNDLVRSEYKGLFEDVEGAMERRYLQAVRQVSHDIDWFIGQLSARPGWEDILVVLVSDHGEGLNSHPSVVNSSFHGDLLYESQLMVPLILYSTSGALPEGLVVERPVQLLDLMPTLLELLGISPPEQLRGVSLVPLLHGDDVNLPRCFVVETHFRDTNKIGVYTDDWKLFHNRDHHQGLNPVALHRIGVMEDGVRTDLGSTHPEILRELSSYLIDWEERNPSAKPIQYKSALPSEMIDQLRSLGYLQ